MCFLVALAAFATACGGGDDTSGPKLPGATTTSRPKLPGATTTSSAATGATGTGTGISGVTTSKAAVPTTTGVPTTPTVFTTTPPGSVPGPAKLVDSSAVSTAGVGPLTFGLTVPNAEKALGTRLLPDAAFPAAKECIVVKPESGADAVWFTVSKGAVERLDVRPPGKVKTRSGAGIASSEAQLKGLFADRLTIASTATGKTATYTPQDAANANFRIIFELDLAGNVTSYRAGRVGVVEPFAPCG
ncbi:unannotated protein [freshwater metagenome]|uniref:Unannotated protein n=1 Tax=freshwater metagenome TaxID=449393 RepID=A0A6J7A1F1_9ZZZZ